MATIALKATCKNPKNLFCFVCGIYTKSHHKRSIMTKPMIDAYEAFFQQRTTKPNYVHGPPSVCNDCNNALLRWANGLVVRPELKFDVPMIWREPTNHQTDCYFCMTSSVVPGRRAAAYLNEPVEYPNDLRSATKPRLANVTKATVRTAGPDGSVNRRGRSMGAIVYAPPAKHPHVMNTLDGKPVAANAPAQPTNARRLVKQIGPVLVTGTKRKSSIDVPCANTYDVRKVRLRSSAPSVVLEHSEKRLPTNSVAMASPSASVRSYQRDNPTSAATIPHQPMITRVFSLQGKIPAYDDFSSSPTALMRAINGHIEMPVTIEIDDDDEEDAAEAVKLLEPMNEVIQKKEDVEIFPLEQQNEDQDTDKTAQEQEQKPVEDLKEKLSLAQGIEPPEQQPVEENRKPLVAAAAAAEFINIHSLPSASSTASSKMVVVKLPSPRKLNVETPSAGATGTLTTNSTPNPTQPVVTARTPHLITQSELILLLRDLELTREKSAILIDRLKRWNLLAAQLVKPTQPRVSGPPADQPTPRVTMVATSPMGSVTIKQGSGKPVVLTTPTGAHRNWGQSFIRLTSDAVQSNTVTTSINSSNNSKVTVTNGAPVLRQQLRAVGGSRSPVRSPS